MNRTKNSFALGAALCAALIAASSSALADEIKLRMVGAWAPEFSPSADVGHNFMKNVNRIGEGKVRIDYIGAADVVPTFDQPEALVNGVFDVWYGAPNYWAGVVPAGDITELSPFDTPDNGPGSELYDFMVDLYAAKGVRYVGHAAGLPGIGAHYISSQKKVEGLDGLEGMKLRVAPLTRHFAQAAGAEPITLPPSEIYLAMDRGTVDGFTWPVADAFTRYKWQQVSKYLIDQPMYRSGVSVNINQSVWDELPDDVKQIMLDAMAETQEWTRGWFQKNLDEQIAGMKEAGMEVVAISPEESEKWTNLAEEALWDYYQSVMDPETFAKAEELLQRGS